MSNLYKLKFEQEQFTQGYSTVIGCDEVGRGCLAGPVVAAAVLIKNCDIPKALMLQDVKDSKQLTANKREELSKIIKETLSWSIAEVAPEVIDEINIHNASLLAMKKAVAELLVSNIGGENKRLLCVDGKFKIPNITEKQQAIIGGDNKVFCIAAASIIAKVYRDTLMSQLHQNFPLYNLKQHKGYATLEHRSIIKQYGLSPIHRLTFCKALV